MADSPLQSSPTSEGREDHWACHDTVCNGDRRHPRYARGVGCSCGTRDSRTSDELVTLRASLTETQAEIERLKSAALSAIPTSWLDSLLTGREAVIGKSPYTERDIERLLKGLRARMQDVMVSDGAQ